MKRRHLLPRNFRHKRKLTRTQFESCPNCLGHGGFITSPTGDISHCERCEGTGKIKINPYEAKVVPCSTLDSADLYDKIVLQWKLMVGQAKHHNIQTAEQNSVRP